MRGRIEDRAKDVRSCELELSPALEIGSGEL